MHGIVQDLNSFAGGIPDEMEYVDIHDGIESTLNLLRYQLNHKATLQKKYGKLPKIHCNLSRLNQVFLNLFLNASQAIKDKGEIIVETYFDNGKVHIAISDTGIGIDPKNMYKIFEPFYTTKKKGEGLGLGLSTALGIVKSHSGDIKVESTLHQGSRFIVMLPVQATD